MPARLDPDVKRLRSVADGELADEAGRLKAALARIKDEAIRRDLTRAEGALWRITLSPPGRATRLDRGAVEAEFGSLADFCYEIDTDWRMNVSARKGVG